MIAATIARYLGRILEANDVMALTALAAEIRREHPGDEEAETVARQADMKGRRIRQEN